MNDFQILKEHLYKQNKEKSAEILKKLIDEYEKDVLHNLLMNNVLPEPLSRNFNNKVIYFFSDVIINLEEDIRQDIYVILVQYVISSQELRDKVKYIESELSELDFFEINPIKQLQILAIFMEDQERLMYEELFDNYKNKSIVTPNEALSLDLEDNVTGNKQSYVENYENLVDVFDVIFRYIFWKYEEFDDKYFICWPYNNSSVHKLKVFAEQRKFIENLWQDIKYFNWKLFREDDKNLSIYCSNDSKLYKHMEAGSYRKLLYSYELANQIQEANQSNRFHEKLYNLDVNIDTNNKVWDPTKFSEEIVEIFKYQHPEELMLEEHFGTLYNKRINDFEFGYEKEEVSGDLLMVTWKLFYVLAVIYQRNSWKVVNNDDKNKKVYNKLIPFIEKNKITDLLNLLTEYDKKECINAVKLLQFNSNQKMLDLGLQPLVKIKNNKLIMIPTLCKNLNLIRLFEAHLLQWDINLDGFKFEEEIKNTLMDMNISVSSEKISFMASDDKEVEYDLLFLFKDYLFIVEAKCLKQPYSSKNRYNVKKDIDKGVKQLKRRKRIVFSDWDSIKDNSNIDLPSNPPSETKVIPLLINNLFTFTGMEFDDVLVSDYKALFKYLKDPRIISVKYNNKKSIKKTIGTIWNDNEPTPKELIDYLKKPKSLDNILDNLDLKPKFVPPLQEGNNIISVLTYLLDDFDITDLNI